MDTRDQIQARAREVANRVKTDPTFKAQLEKDPVGTLKSVGLPSEITTDFLREVGLEADVAGYCIWTCGVTLATN